MTRLKIAIVGGGSVAWVPNVVRDMLLTPSIARADFVLLDTDKAASDRTAAFLEKLAAELGVDATFTSTSQPRAMQGAQYVVITISTGGLDAMAHDLKIPERFGIYHTVGDTSGPGGWARAIRNFPVFVKLAEQLNRYCPDALVLNYTNPMTVLTDVLARLCKGPVVGLCHGLFENIRLLTRFYKLDSEEQVALRYAGINHFFWCTEVKAGKKDALADLDRRLNRRGQSFTDLLNEAFADEMGFGSRREVATELFRLTGVMPYLGDRHTAEFFPHYITSRAALKKYQLVRTSIADRRRLYRRNRQRLERMIKGRIPAGFHQRTRETAADIIEAHSQGKVFIDVGNVPNTGQITNLPRGLVVETAVRVDRTGFTPLAFGKLPRVIEGFIAPYALAMPMLVDACFANDKKLAMQALRLDPVCAHLDGDQVQALGDQLLAAHKQFVPALR